MTDGSSRIFCVLKTGRAWGLQKAEKVVEYRPEHVRRLQQQVRQYYTPDHPWEFVCLSDVSIPGVQTLPLIHNWPGWWSKIELFRPDVQTSRNFYLDLDSTIQRPIDQLVDHPHKFTVLDNLTSPGEGRIGSGLMAWADGQGLSVYNRFLEDPEEHMQSCRTTDRWGDQGFVQDTMDRLELWQTLFPGSVASSKRGEQAVRDQAAIVCFHGLPKPWTTTRPVKKQLAATGSRKRKPRSVR